MEYKNFWIKTQRVNDYEEYEQLLFFIIHHAAITLHQEKVASLVVFSDVTSMSKTTWQKYKHQIEEELHVRFFVLSSDEQREIVLFYNPKMLKETLNDEKHQKFLEMFGYDDFSIRGALNRLESRFDCVCPHEIGLFLGYPVEDVKCFANCTGTCLVTGYWKVFTDVESAVATFNRYDQIRNEYAILLKSGYLPSEIIKQSYREEQ